MFWDIFLFAVGTLLVIKGGDWFVDASVSIAEKTRLPKVLIGATIVSIATAMPELLVSVIAVLEGETGLGLGNNIGSVICNTTLILSITLIICKPFQVGFAFVRKGLFLLFCIVFLIFQASDMHIEMHEGVLLLILFLCFLWMNIREAKVTLNKKKADSPAGSGMHPTRMLVLFVIGAAALVVGADMMVEHGVMIATWFGVSSRVIGLTIVALGTSLPELVTALKALARKEYGLSIGNIVGANIVNLTLIPGLCALLSHGHFGFNDQSNLLLFDMPVALLAQSIFIVPAVFSRGRVSRWQGIVMFTLYIIYIACLLF